MRYAATTPNPVDWPNEMVVEVDDHDLEILELLFVRSAWGLGGHSGAPVSTGPIDTGSSRRPVRLRDDVERTWADEWATLLQSKPTIRNTTRWHDKYGWEGIDQEALEAWVDSVRGESRQMRPIEEAPETKAQGSLIAAWRRGLRRVTVLPVEAWSQQRDEDELIVAAEVRADESAYRLALDGFTSSR
ncbi:hypothetical protein BIU97_13995 [Curtobacterium sp. MCBA15_009]|uniref:hypothetical protein n=1 Tax=Curtobacterium sp. MCBA15_009 TaxID=1898737 RepID=UPI0008DD79B7|nr:hypothetical protein [Curtobacterium sp. MCBA15_009]OII15777.1 hypothetical protein BIU97_13995 [Curtobacterium sp. MCBA15_009]